MKKENHIGCSGYNNGYWKGIFYPEKLARSKWFDYYCEHFNTYEMNGTFYKFPTESNLLKWYEKAPEGFVFAVKASKIITHIKKFSDCEKEITDFYTICKNGLKEKLGAVLFQLPPSFYFSEERLELIINSMLPEFKNVIEFRHETWWNPIVFEKLSKHNIIFCSVSYPGLPENIVKTSPVGYLRLHGNKKLFYSEYSESELNNFHKEFISTNSFDETFTFFNNTASTAGINNAVLFKAII